MHIKRLIIVAVIASLFGLSGCTKDLVTGKDTYNWYSLAADVNLGNKVLKSQSNALRKKKTKKGTPVLDPPQQKKELMQLRKVVARIKPVTHYPQFPYEVHLADVDIANAWCAPGGKMMVFTGLWDPKKGLVRKGNEAELAAVLSHEMAHANARHVTEMVSRGMTIGLIGTAAQAGIYHGAGSTAAGAFGQAANMGMNIYFPMYSRGNETEADKVGLMYMAKAGYDPRVAVRLWERAARSKNKKSYTIFASHPQSGQRAATLRRMLPKVMPVYEANKHKNEKPRKRRRKKK